LTRSPRTDAGEDLRRRIRNIVAGSGRPAMRLPRRQCPESPARARWRADVAQALTDLRDARPRGPVMRSSAGELVRQLIGETLRLRLEDCYRVMFLRLDRMERTIALRPGDLWKPPARTPQIQPMTEAELPRFLRMQ